MPTSCRHGPRGVEKCRRLLAARTCATAATVRWTSDDANRIAAGGGRPVRHASSQRARERSDYDVQSLVVWLASIIGVVDMSHGFMQQGFDVRIV